MKLYIESYQTKIEDLEPLEEKCEELQKEIDDYKSLYEKVDSELSDLKNLYKEKQAEWKINLNKQKSEQSNGVCKQCEKYCNIMITNRTYSGSNEKSKNIKSFSNNIEAKNLKKELILLKDES